jgi:hypothetical protein
MIILAISFTRTIRSPGFSKQAFAHKDPFGGDPTFGRISIVAYPLDKHVSTYNTNQVTDVSYLTQICDDKVVNPFSRPLIPITSSWN